MPDSLNRADEAPVLIEDEAHEPVYGNGWMVPAVGSVVLTLLWGAYVVKFVAEMLAMPPP